MNRGIVSSLLVIVASAPLVACLFNPIGSVGSSDDKTPSSSPPSSSSSSSSPSSPPKPSQCTGTPLACSKYHPDSCGSQFNCGSGYSSGSCTETSYHGGPPSCGNASDKYACVNTIGCTWNELDGTTARIEHGTCEGTAAKCDSLKNEADCEKQPAYAYGTDGACTWFSDYYNGQSITACNKVSETECSNFSAPAPAADAMYVRHPLSAKSTCELRAGCTWKPIPN